jgi:hypothetical protein
LPAQQVHAEDLGVKVDGPVKIASSEHGVEKAHGFVFQEILGNRYSALLRRLSRNHPDQCRLALVPDSPATCLTSKARQHQAHQTAIRLSLRS